MIQLYSNDPIWPDAMVVSFGPQPEVLPDLLDGDQQNGEDFYCGTCRHFHDEGGPCGPQGPCGRFDCCIN